LIKVSRSGHGTSEGAPRIVLKEKPSRYATGMTENTQIARQKPQNPQLTQANDAIHSTHITQINNLSRTD